MRKYAHHVEEAYKIFNTTIGVQDKLVTKAELEKIYIISDHTTPEEYNQIMGKILAKKTTLTKEYKKILAKQSKNKKDISPAGLLLKRLTRSNKALSKQLEEYNGELYINRDEAALISAFTDSLITLFFRFSEILEALGNPQEHIVIIEEDEEED